MIQHRQPIKNKKPTMINPTKSSLDHPQLTKAAVINPTKNPDQTQTTTTVRGESLRE